MNHKELENKIIGLEKSVKYLEEICGRLLFRLTIEHEIRGGLIKTLDKYPRLKQAFERSI